jgi:transposase
MTQVNRFVGLDVRVCAPGHILKRGSDRIKTDKRDALQLARLLLAGELRPVRVPSPEEEQLRDLVLGLEVVSEDDLARAVACELSAFCWEVARLD